MSEKPLYRDAGSSVGETDFSVQNLATEIAAQLGHTRNRRAFCSHFRCFIRKEDKVSSG